MKEVKEYIKDHFVLCIVFVVVIVGLICYRVFFVVKDKVEEATANVKTVTEVVHSNHDYDVNEYQVITKSDQDLAEFYYNKLKKMWINNPEDLYNLMTTKCKTYYESKEAFVTYMNNLKTSLTATSTVSKYLVSGNTIVIQSSENMQFKLTQSGINDYVINVIGQVEE